MKFITIFIKIQIVEFIFFLEHEQSGSVKWTKHIILFDAALICLLCKEVGIMVLVRFSVDFIILTIPVHNKSFYSSLQPLCAVYDITMNVKFPKVRRRDAGRRYEFLRNSCHNVIVRCTYLTLMSIALIVLRSLCSRNTFPKFTAHENPLAAHPSIFTRVSFMQS